MRLVDCIRCNKRIPTGRVVYCEACYSDLQAEIYALNRKIRSLKDEIGSLKEEIAALEPGE